jgi:hypothetical protein
LTAIRRTRRVQRVVLVSDVSEKFKARFDGASEKQERLARCHPCATLGLDAALMGNFARDQGPKRLKYIPRVDEIL